MLINCPECKKEISDKAPSCPNCGTLIAKLGATTRQETSKKLKLHYTLSATLILISIIMLFFEDESVIKYGAVCAAVGIIWMIVTKIRIWWHHK